MEITEDLLSSQRFSKEEINHIVDYLEENPERLYQLLESFKSKEDYVVFQTSWIFLTASKRKNLKPHIVEILPHIFPLVKSTSNNSFLRNGTRYFIEAGIPLQLEDDLIDFCFQLLDNKFNEVAILNNAFSILEKFLKKQPELIQPLYEATHMIKDRQPTSFQHKFKKYYAKYQNDIRDID